MSQTASAVMVEVTLACGHVVAAPKHSDRPAACPNRCNDTAAQPVIKPRTRG